MFLLDIKTILVTNLIVSLVCTSLIIILWMQYHRRYAGLTFWLANFISQLLAALLMMLRGQIPDWISIVVANVLIVGGPVLLLEGLRRFIGKKGSQIHNYILLLIFAIVHIYFTFYQPNMFARNLNISAGLLVMSSQIAWSVLAKKEPQIRHMAFSVGMVFLVYVILSATRIVITILNPDQINDLFQLDTINAIFIASLSLIQVLLIYALTWSVNRRLLSEIEMQKEKLDKVFRLSPNAIIISRKDDGKIIEANEGFEVMSGYARSEFMGKTSLELDIWEKAGDRKRIVDELTRSNKVRGMEFSFRRKSGEIISGLFYAELITMDGEQCILSTIVDITLRKNGEMALRKTKQELESTLEDFYTLRIGMENDLKRSQVSSENRKIKKRLDKLKKSK